METDFQIQAPHEEALALLRGKPAVAREVFDGLLPELRARVFTITGVTGAGTLQRCRDVIAGIASGETWEDAKKSLIAELDPWLGDGSEKRAEILLRTHGYQVFEAASHQVGMEDEDTTHFQYLTMEDDRVRDSHAALDGVIVAKDDPFWDTHTPPWDWGCRCHKRPMNRDMVAEEKAAEEEKNPEDRNVMEGAALAQLKNGTIIRDGRRFNVTPPSEKPNDGIAYQFHPDDLRLPLDELKQRYDPEVWDGFKKWSAGTEISEGRSVWDWLNGEAAAAELPTAPKQPSIQDAIAAKVKAAKLSKEVQEAAAGLPDKVAALAATAEFHLTKGGAYYRRSDRGIRLLKNPHDWSGSVTTFHHELGHHLHYETGVVNELSTRPDFQKALAADFARWKEWAAENHGPAWAEIFKRGQVYRTAEELSKHLGFGGYDSSNVEAAKRVSRIADTIMGLSKGKYGFGHALNYMSRNGDKEVFAHAYSALAQGDEAFKKLFPNVVNVVKEELGL